MRAREFITENDHRLDLSNPQIKGARHMPDMDKYYELYRLSLDMAEATDEITGERIGQPVSNHVVMLAYTDGDEQILNKAMRKRGIKYRSTTSRHSQELNDTNKSSPVAKPKRNRYGV